MLKIKRSKSGNIYKNLFVLGFLGYVIFQIFVLYESINVKKRYLASLEMEVKLCMQKNQKLKNMISFSEKKCIESIARQQGYVLPCEKVFFDVSD